MHFTTLGVDIHPLLPPAIAFVISFISSIGGVSGAFLLLPFQVSVLGFSSPAVTPTNLVYNIIAIPSGVYGYIKEGRMVWPIALIIVLGTLPGVLIGVVIRIIYLPYPGEFKLFVGSVLLYLGLQLLYQATERHKKGKMEFESQKTISNKRVKEIMENQNEILISNHAPVAGIKTVQFSLCKYTYEFEGERYSFNTILLFIVAFIAGVVGGIYGVGGGIIIAPVCVALLGLPVYTVTGASLLGALVTSIVGVGYYHIAAYIYANSSLNVMPNWNLGIFFGIGGFIGMYCGAKVQKYIPEKIIKIILGLLISSLAIQYIFQFFN